MIVTEFLPISQFDQYGDWLKSQDAETQEMYFGIAGSEHVIDALMDQIRTYSEDHWILVARDRTQWAGTLHIAVDATRVELGIIVDKNHRGKGIASQMLEEALIWARNRNYTELFMHCLGWNKPVQHLCYKHGLRPHNVYGDAEVQIKLDPPSWMTITKEVGIQQRNVFHTFLQNSNFLYQEIYG
jgi:GNAT superfamily N-acetyltransferase